MDDYSHDYPHCNYGYCSIHNVVHVPSEGYEDKNFALSNEQMMVKNMISGTKSWLIKIQNMILEGKTKEVPKAIDGCLKFLDSIKT
jgi:hypothetical protein